MIANTYRTFICDRCGHSERLDLDDYLCRCQKCTELNRAA
jgi:hypothetical protein